jgi:hypothetical protein
MRFLMPEGKLSKRASLEERIKCILCMQELEMDGNAYKGKYELDNIKVSGRSARELTNNFDFNNQAYQKSLAHIPEIIEEMQFLEKMPADKAHSHFDEYSY